MHTVHIHVILVESERYNIIRRLLILPVFSDVEHGEPFVTIFGIKIETTQMSLEIKLCQRASSVATRQHLKVASYSRQHGRQLQLKPTDNRLPDKDVQNLDRCRNFTFYRKFAVYIGLNKSMNIVHPKVYQLSLPHVGNK